MNRGGRPVKQASLCLVLLLVAAPAAAQEFWAKKPYQQWSRKESLEILTDSPWAQTEDLLKEGSAYGDSLQARLRVQNDPFPSLLATSVRLRSALPVRQAFVRQRQLGIKYDKLGGADRAKFDAEVAEFLECPPCAKYYIVTVDSAFLNSRNKTFPAEYSLDKLRSNAYLANDSGQWRECAHVRRETQEILFFFRREGDDGKPLITSDNKTFAFTMTGVLSDGKLSSESYWEFKVSKLTHKGEIIF
jgi:hypothetical protein